ncbi:MAG: 6-phosphogluconolactonase, partial [Acetobacteraceae bacterium]|nr:6-phosphogluconolactonase [Acetobacteraceae bacterium]
EWVVERLTATQGEVAVALSGGSTPKLLYRVLATDEFARRMPWDRVHWCWGDERFVAPDDPASNYRMAREAMLDHVPVPASHVHPIPTTGMSAAAAAETYGRTLLALHGGGNLARPVFEIVLLGLGTNGHLASLFPGTDSLTEREVWATAVTPAGEKTRITLTYPVLESCRHAAFLVAGADKREVLARVRAGEADLPASHYRPRGQLHWFVDAAAEAGPEAS